MTRAVLGSEAASVVAAVDPGVNGFRHGELIAYASAGAPATYADPRAIAAV